jgi:hypothetical protein
MLALSAKPSAHRLDEYLQATRVSLERTQVTLEMDLTPGATVAASVIALVDRDGDGRISPLEARSYADVVLADVVVELDGRDIPMTLARVEAPSIDEMRRGMGTIQVRAAGHVEQGPFWRRQRRLHFRNNHHEAGSVYLVNALMPSDRAIVVVAQTRDAIQRGARIDYNVGPQWAQYAYWPIVGLVVGGWWAVGGWFVSRERFGRARFAARSDPT